MAVALEKIDMGNPLTARTNAQKGLVEEQNKMPPAPVSDNELHFALTKPTIRRMFGQPLAFIAV